MPLGNQTPTLPTYVGFGMLPPVVSLVLEQLPKHNTGARTYFWQREKHVLGMLDTALLARYAGRARICQVVTDTAQIKVERPAVPAGNQ